MCNPPKSGTSPVFITFFQVTQKIRTKDIFHWLEVITEFLSFLQILSVRKNSAKNRRNKTIFLAYFGSLKASYRFFFRLLTLHCFFLTLITFCTCIKSYIHICFYYFLILCFVFTFPFLIFSPTVYNVSYNFIANWP